jgi:hypothetical protein
MKFRPINNFHIVALIGLVIAVTGNCFALDLYVSTTGKDTNPGTITRPLATLNAAQTKIRTLHEPVTVYVRAGTYYLKKPIIFTTEDSRKPEHAVVYKAYQNEKVTISSAARLSLRWQHHKQNIFKASVPDDILFDQLFVNGILQRMARYPNYDPKSSHFGGYSVDVLSPEKIKTWQHPEGAFIHALHKHEWGGYHYRVTGKETNERLTLEGGFQNNRQMGMHNQYRFIENLLEELDTTNEWYFDKTQKMLYLYASTARDLSKAEILSPQLKSLFEFRGSEATPVRNISIEGFELIHVLRTFMDTREPLLRSDWAIYRGGTVVLEGTEHCQIRNCHFKEVGGNAVFFSNYNRESKISSCHIENIGASGVCFVGDPAAVRSPAFEYNEAVPYEQMDKKPGPKTNNYPAECEVSDNLMHGLGQVEKQVAGVEISMAMGILVKDNTIYDVPRAGINVSEGTWGGHIIEFNDVFNTVLETGDHGSFNSWGRDRFWHPNREAMNKLATEHPEIILLDAQKTTIIRNNRFRCDHGWDIDLDDGSSNYHIYNNLCLNGGLKLREGFKRLVENNIIVNNSFHPHVWFANSGDVFRKNIVMKPYYPIQIKEWGKEVDFNLFPDETALDAAKANQTDVHSLAGDPLFSDPLTGDFQVKAGSPAFKTGFINFPMHEFGVVSTSLKSIAKKVPLPVIQQTTVQSKVNKMEWLGGKLRNVSGLGDRSAFGLPDERGVIIEDILTGSVLGKSPVRQGDVIRKMNQKEISDIDDLNNVFQEINWTGRSVIEVIRNQKIISIELLLR